MSRIIDIPGKNQWLGVPGVQADKIHWNYLESRCVLPISSVTRGCHDFTVKSKGKCGNSRRCLVEIRVDDGDSRPGQTCPESLLFLRETLVLGPGPLLFRACAAYFRWN